MKVSDEVLIEMLRPFSSKRDRSIARELLQYRQAKPVAWWRDCNVGKSIYPFPDKPREHAPTVGDNGEQLWEPLYAHPGEDAKEKP